MLVHWVCVVASMLPSGLANSSDGTLHEYLALNSIACFGVPTLFACRAMVLQVRAVLSEACWPALQACREEGQRLGPAPAERIICIVSVANVFWNC